MQGDSELQQLYKSDRNPSQEARFQQLLKQQGLSTSDIGGAGGNGADASTLSGGNMQGLQANKAYQQATQQAVGGLQTQKASLADQYSDLLKTVKGQYEPLINQATTQENNFLGARGLLSNTGTGGNQMSQTLQSIYGQQAGNAQQIGQGSINDMNTLAQAIAQLQQGGAQFGAQLPLQYGQLALQQQQQPYQNALLQSQASQVGGQNATQLALQRLANQFQNVPAGNSLVNTLANFAINPSMLTQRGGGVSFLQ